MFVGVERKRKGKEKEKGEWAVVSIGMEYLGWRLYLNEHEKIIAYRLAYTRMINQSSGLDE